MNDRASRSVPILAEKHHGAPSAFTPENLLREARRQKGIATASVPPVCVLDPDGDMVRQLRREGRAHPDPGWACYHTELYRISEGGELGLIGCAVGASFAVLIAEQLFASGCELLISMTSAGQLIHLRPPPYFIVIDKALRDEGTSYHYLPSTEFSHANGPLLDLVANARPRVHAATWACRSSAAPPGRQTHPFARPPRRSPPCSPKACWPSRWRQRLSMPSRRPGGSRSSALRM